jgi:hypothetical protein
LDAEYPQIGLKIDIDGDRSFEEMFPIHTGSGIIITMAAITAGKA